MHRKIQNVLYERLIRFITEHPDKPWDLNGIYNNPNLTIDIIPKLKNPDWSHLSENQNLQYQGRTTKEAQVVE